MTRDRGFEHEQAQYRVVDANNEDVNWRTSLIILAAAIVPSTMIGFGLGAGVGWSYEVRAGVSGLLIMVIAVLSYPFLSGDAAAMLEIWQRNKTNRKHADVEMVKAKGTIEVARMEHKREMLIIEQHQNDRQLRRDVAAIAENREAPRGVFVAAKTDMAADAAESWLFEQFDRHGQWRKGKVYQGGTVQCKLPWTEEWSGAEWCSEAMDLLIKGNDSPLIAQKNETTGRVNGYKMRHASRVDALNSIGRG